MYVSEFFYDQIWLVTFKKNDARYLIVSKINVKEEDGGLVGYDGTAWRYKCHLISLGSKIVH